MRLSLACAVVAAAVTLGVPAAHAGASSTYQGGCGFDAMWTSLDEPRAYAGVMYAKAVLYSATDGDNPVSATVTCELFVEGVVAETATFSGTGVVVGAVPIAYDYTDYQSLDFCETVDYTSDDTPTMTLCSPIHPGSPPPSFDCVFDMLNRPAGRRDYPPEWVLCDLAEAVVGPVIGLLDPTIPDAVLCPVLGGDVYAGDELVWDCPPYETES